MTGLILWIEGKRADSPSFIPGLRKKGFEINLASSGKEALDRLDEVDPDLLVVNAVSLRSSGKRICQKIKAEKNGLPILVISTAEKSLTGDPSVNIALNLPFTVRKLVNRIIPLLPIDFEKIVHLGPINLDPENNIVRCHGRKTRLTPRLTTLLLTFMDQPGVLHKRSTLFRRVWETDYLGDTRTLDVHINWLRNAIELMPSKPTMLKTIRGVGYRLDV